MYFYLQLYPSENEIECISSQTMLTSFAFFQFPCVDIFHLINIDKMSTFLDYLPTSSCQRSLWTLPNFKKTFNSQFFWNWCNGSHWVLAGNPWPKTVEFCDLAGAAIAPVSKKLAVKALYGKVVDLSIFHFLRPNIDCKGKPQSIQELQSLCLFIAYINLQCAAWQ